MAGRTKHIIKWVALAALAGVVALVLHRCYRRARGIEVCLHNVDSQPLRSGEVAARSSASTRSSKVGDLAPGDTACVWVKPDSEASVDVTFTTPGGASKVIPLDGYVEPGYSGRISAEVTAAGARHIETDIDLF